MNAPQSVVELARSRLGAASQAWLAATLEHCSTASTIEPLCQAVSMASRHAKPSAMLAPHAGERALLATAVSGFDPQRWTLLETVRVGLIASWNGWSTPRASLDLEELFRYVDVGEACASYRALAALPQPERFAWRAGEGARSNMRAIFEATCCDTPYPVRFFDDLAWRQAVIKALFIGAPLARFVGLESRRDEVLARMALDLADERTSAGREVPPDLWSCLGRHGGIRAAAAMEREIARGSPAGRQAAQRALEHIAAASS